MWIRLNYTLISVGSTPKVGGGGHDVLGLDYTAVIYTTKKIKIII